MFTIFAARAAQCSAHWSLGSTVCKKKKIMIDYLFIINIYCGGNRRQDADDPFLLSMVLLDRGVVESLQWTSVVLTDAAAGLLDTPVSSQTSALVHEQAFLQMSPNLVRVASFPKMHRRASLQVQGQKIDES
jgi:hypothetical protein